MLEYFNTLEIELLAQRLLFILEQFESPFRKSLNTISVLSEAELSVVKNFNQVDDLSISNSTINDLFEQQVVSHPNASALIFEDEIITYQQLDSSSNQLANYLITKGVNLEEMVPICLERGSHFILVILGILKAGASYVPIDLSYPMQRIQFMLKDTKAKMVVSETLESQDSIEYINLKLQNTELQKQSTLKPKIKLHPSNRAYVIYTSGCTGTPKGVEIEHQSVVNLIESQTAYFKINSTDRIVQFSHPSFDASVEQIFLALTNGASLILFEEGLRTQTHEFEQFLITKRLPICMPLLAF